MKVFYDHQIFASQNFGGISRYFYELIGYFRKTKEIEVDLSVLFSNNQLLPSLMKGKKYYPIPEFYFPGLMKSIRLMNKLHSSKELKKGNFDIFHPTDINPYFMNHLNGKPFVLTIHDMIHEKFKMNFATGDSSASWKKILAIKASRIITVSENSKKDLIEILNIDPGKVDVIYHGCSLGLFTENSTSPFGGRDYILFVGSRKSYKNFNTFITSISGLITEENINVVCIGGGGFDKSELCLFEKLKIKNRLIQVNASDFTLNTFYKNALLFVFPSLYEGFGMPILESFSCGCPLACSNTSSFPEVAGNAAVFFNPNNQNEIHEAVKKLLYNENLRKELVLKGEERLKSFSWKNAAIQTKQVYERTLT